MTEDKLAKGDFIEVEYTGRIANSGQVFDTTSSDAAKKANIFHEGTTYETVIVQLGQHRLLMGLERQLEGKEVGKEYKFKVLPEEGFGKKTTKLIQLVPTSKFRQQNVTPMPGLQVNIDGIAGTIKTVSGGRTIVDFNHPLAGRELEYDLVVKRKVTDTKEKVNAVLNLLGVKVGITVEGEKATLTTSEQVPEEIQKKVRDEITKAVPEVKSIDFVKESMPAEK